MILKDTDELIRLTNTPAADLDVLATYVDLTVSTGAIDAGATPNTYTTAQTNATIVGSPGAGVRRKVKYICVTNRDSADATGVTINYFDGTTSVEQMRTVTLASQESLVYADGTWFVYDANGGVKTDAVLASDTVPGRIQVATQAEQEAGTSTTLAVTPGRQHFHPSAAKFWIKANGAGTSNLASYNVTSIADTGTGRLGVTIATDFSSVNYCVQGMVERSVTSLAEAGVEGFAIRNASQAAGTVEIESFDHTATTMVAQDPANYHVVGFGDQ